MEDQRSQGIDDAPDVWLGTVTLDPAGPIVAGSVGTWTILYRTGRYGIDTGGRLRVAWRIASDWGAPQTSHPAAGNYVTAATTAGASVDLRYDRSGCSTRPFLQGLTVTVTDGTLREGDEISIVLGDTSAGGPGAMAQCFADEAFEFRVLVECFQTNVFRRLPSSPIVRITNGSPARLVVTAPTQVVVGVPFGVAVRLEDLWGNLCRDAEEMVMFEPASALHVAAGGSRIAGGLGHATAGGFLAEATGIMTVAADVPRLSLHARSNPIQVLAERPALRLLWGDIHGQTGETVGTGTPEAYFHYGREVARLDYCAHQANDFQIEQAQWDRLKDIVHRAHDPGRFITFLGYEWSGNTPAGGDRNVYYSGNDGPLHRSSHWQVMDRSDTHLDRYPISDLHATLRSRGDVLMIPHVGGRPCDLAFHDPTLEPVVEICSVWGEFEWLAEDALRRGYTVGFVANSDDHTCRPGTTRGLNHHFAHRGGLTAVLARECTREAIWEAYFARRCYATSGERILLMVESDGHPMGDLYATGGSPTLSVHVAGAGPLQFVEVRRTLEVCYRLALEQAPWVPGAVRITWEGARSRGRTRVTRWDGRLHLSGGRILRARDIHRRNPGLGITEHGPHDVTWRSRTAGDLAGVLLELESPPQGRLEFATAPCHFTFTLADLEAQGEIVVDAGGVGQRVTVSRVPAAPIPSEARFAFTDAAAPPGRHAYWVRVQQADGERAWSSPIYVTVAPRASATASP